MGKAQIIERQGVLVVEAVSIYTKLKAKGARRAVVEVTANKVESIWSEFEKNHQTLLAAGVTNEVYFKQNCYEKMSETIEQIRVLLAEIVTQEQSQQKEVHLSGELKEKSVEEHKDVSSVRDNSTTMTKKMKSLRIAINRGLIEIEGGTKEDLIAAKELLNRRSQSLDVFYEEASLSLSEDTEEDYMRLQDDVLSAIKQLNMALNSRDTKKQHSSSTLKLTEIKIPTFFGDLNDWPSYHDLFKNMVHDNEQLSNAEKMYRLKTSIKGEAARLIQHLRITEANYEASWSMLKQRYENRRLLFTNQVDRILDQPAANSESAASMKQLLDTTNECMNALRSLEIQMEEAEPFIARIVIRKLDRDGLRLYEQNVKRTKDIQSLEEVMSFLEQQYQALEALKGRKPIVKTTNFKGQQRPTNAYYTAQQQCEYCKAPGHGIDVCRKFEQLAVTERKSYVQKYKICFLCLKHQSDIKCMNSSVECRKCGKRHNTLLHYDEFKRGSSSHPERAQGKSAALMTEDSRSPTVLLATAQVRVKSANGDQVVLRALIDQGSQKTTISEEAAQLLQLPRKKLKTELYGLGGTIVGVSKSKINIEIAPRFLSNTTFKSEALVLPVLASAQPDKSFKYEIDSWKNHVLADPSFNKSDRIDIVIGSDLYTDLMEEGIYKVGKILGQSTKLGWILSGVLQKLSGVNKITAAVTTSLERFWELDDVKTEEAVIEDDECLKYYKKTTVLGDDGRFVVKLPLQEDKELGDSRKQAMARFFHLERRLKASPQLKRDYVKFMREYIDLGHMVEAQDEMQGKYYLPHQAVIRESSSTTKLRVVFDASAKTTNGSSLNDILFVGPRLQKDIFDIVLKWRLWKNVITADVEKMYRQVKVADEDCDYQRILWRENSVEPIKEYKLKTVTYGTASAPFLATRTLQEIATKCKNLTVSGIIRDDFYMDDLMTGADSEGECRTIQVQISEHLERSGFHLRKWLSNNRQITAGIPNISDNEVVSISEDEAVKTLGLQWKPQKDEFSFGINVSEQLSITKRQALSTLARIFDPLGWLAPVTITAKLFIQKLWIMDTDWDEKLNEELTTEWRNYVMELPSIEAVKIPRWLNIFKNSVWQMHGFADASEKAYAAVIYSKIGSTVTIIAARSKVNPIKNKKTLPKLELCAAHLLAKLLNKATNIVQRECKIYAWSDSMITLGWIQNNRSKDKFIRSRVSEVRSLVPNATWKYVKSKDNPADVASRGISPNKLETNELWWNGPAWLKHDESTWLADPERDEGKVLAATTRSTSSKEPNFVESLLSRCSSYTKVERVVARVIRFKNILRGRKYPAHLTAKELFDAQRFIMIHQQSVDFKNEIHCLKNNCEIDRRSRIQNLNPFLDSDGLLKVGGRLTYSCLSIKQRHPIILDKSRLTTLITERVHLTTLHGGNRIMEATIRRSLWIVGMKNIMKKCIRQCPRCTRYRQEAVGQIMGNLPAPRVTPSHPFTHTGVDYAGPVLMKCSRTRGQKSYKGYIAVFVCLATKAVHLEAVSDLTSEAFLAALKRFFARRGRSQHMYSDNGTNFVGACRKLDAEFKEAIKNNVSVIPILESEKVQWHFIPPASPHFGGIWEAGVKAVKHHLRRVIGETKLTYEEMSTLLARIEAVLNSRPLYAISDDVEEIDVLTPGHFLIGHPLIDSPEPSGQPKIGSLDRWKLIQKMRKDFWNRWKNEYLTTLQKRYKWKNPQSNLAKDLIVVVKEESTAPSKWMLGRILEVHPGRDGRVRVVTIKSQGGNFKRPVHKICPLEITANPVEAEVEAVDSYLTRRKPIPKKEDIRIKRWCWLVMAFLCTGVTVNGLQADITNSVTAIKDNTALYYDNIGAVDVVASKWNLVIYYDLSSYFNELDGIRSYVIRLKKQCQILTHFEQACELVTMSLEKRYHTLKSNNELLASDKINERKRRAPFEFVGSIYHALFGVMDADDREEMETEMLKIFENQQNLAKYMKNQTSLIDSTVNILKKTTDEVNASFQKMNGQLNSFYSEIVKNQNSERMALMFQMMTTHLNMMIDECTRIQESVMNLLIDVNHGRINPELLRPAQLHQEIIMIQEKLSAKFKIPGKTTSNKLKEVYNSLVAKGVIVKQRLVIKAEIPLIYKETSALYNIIPLPLDVPGSAIMVKTKVKFIVYNFDLNTYFVMTQAELNNCKKRLNGDFLCMGNRPWLAATDSSCEISGLKHAKQSNCEYEHVIKNELWIKLRDGNKWIFKVFENSTIHLECGARTHWMDIPQQGILALESGCTARHNSVTIAANQNLESQTNEGAISTSWVKNVDSIKDQLVKPFDAVFINNSKDIEFLKTTIDKLKNENIELKKISFHHLSGHASFILITILLIVIAIVYVKSRCTAKQRVKFDFSTIALDRARQNVQI